MPESMNAVYALHVLRIREYKCARLTRSTDDKRADHTSWPAWATASSTFLSIYEWKWHENQFFTGKLLSFFHIELIKSSECWVEYVWRGFIHRILGIGLIVVYVWSVTTIMLSILWTPNSYMVISDHCHLQIFYSLSSIYFVWFMPGDLK